MHLCIESKLSVAEIERRIKPAKFGTAGDLPGLKLRRLRGLKMNLEKETPRGLPGDANVHYFTIEREGHYWQKVVEKGELAIVDADQDLSFSLYLVLPTESGGP